VRIGGDLRDHGTADHHCGNGRARVVDPFQILHVHGRITASFGELLDDPRESPAGQPQDTITQFAPVQIADDRTVLQVQAGILADGYCAARVQGRAQADPRPDPCGLDFEPDQLTGRCRVRGELPRRELGSGFHVAGLVQFADDVFEHLPFQRLYGGAFLAQARAEPVVRGDEPGRRVDEQRERT